LAQLLAHFLKGKNICCQLTPVLNHYIDIPKNLISAQKEITLCIYTMNVNGLNFLTTILRNLQYYTVQWVTNHIPDAYCDKLSQVFRRYNNGGSRLLLTIHCNIEFCPHMESLAQAFHLCMNYANPQEHVPEAVHNNRVFNEQVCAMYHKLLCQHLP
jgi:hypothetical protein